MSTDVILWYGVGVFSLMAVGIVMTAREFRKLERESRARERDGKRESYPHSLTTSQSS